MNEIIETGTLTFFITGIGLSLGLLFLKIQDN